MDRQPFHPSYRRRVNAEQLGAQLGASGAGLRRRGTMERLWAKHEERIWWSSGLDWIYNGANRGAAQGPQPNKGPV